MSGSSVGGSALRSDRRADQAIDIIDRRANQLDRKTGLRKALVGGHVMCGGMSGGESHDRETTGALIRPC